MAEQARILRTPEVSSLTGLSRTTLWRRAKAGHFPEPVQLGGGIIGWKSEDVRRWCDERPTGFGRRPAVA